jgi:predicted O-methyltransferase YrrM
MPLQNVDQVFAPDPKLGYAHATEVSFISIGPLHVAGVTSDYEAWILAVLSRRANVMFEFGTCTGRTAYLWARNSPAGARVYTITLDRAHVERYRAGVEDKSVDEEQALDDEQFFEKLVYSGTDVEHKVTQLYGDSKSFDETPLVGVCDLVFIDGSHARSYVMSDSEKALRMIRPGGIILWHDYRGPGRSPGVYDALNELGKRLPLIQIEGTSLVAYRAPG